MSLSLSLSRAAASMCVLLAASALVQGQNTYLPNGGESAVAGRLPGDQAHPALSIGTNGGFLVWEDNATDRTGLGVSAVGLDSRFGAVQRPFRVNQDGRRDQEQPRVTLLNNGGAAFVWQGGRQGFQHIFARFLSASNAWVAGDVMANASTTCYQKTPVLTTLANGSVVIVYASVNQRAPGSMLDVYAQLFNPDGQKIGSEIEVNQASTLNQRNPAVCALASGGFAVAWVTEQDPQAGDVPTDNTNGVPVTATNLSNLPGVGIAVRLFDATGTPLGNEFQANASADVCGNPSLAGAADGSFLISWGQINSLSPLDGWDVYARTFSSVGAAGPVRRVNTYLRNDQMIPQASALSNDFLVVWTSKGQDGSADGIYGQFLNLDGTRAGAEFRVNTSILGPQKQPAVASDASGRFLVTWTGFGRGAKGFDIYGQGYAMAGFVAPDVVTNYVGSTNGAFIDDLPGGGGGSGGGGGGGAIAGPPRLDYPGSITGASSNVFAASKGSYAGLFYEDQGVSLPSAGYFTATTTDRGGYSARLLRSGLTYSVSGKFNAQGNATNQVRRGSSVVFTVSLHLDSVSGQVQGQVLAPGWTASILADRATFDRRSNPSPFQGTYTLLAPAGDTGPAGSSFGTAIVDANGNVTWSGTLADGTRTTQRSGVSKEGVWPLYSSLYAGKGLLMSWLQFQDSSVGGQVVWIKSKGALGTTYRGGFTNELQAAGSTYTKSATSLLNWPNGEGQLVLIGGGLDTPITNNVTVDAKSRVSGAAGARISVTFNRPTGSFRGSVPNPGGGKAVSFQGALMLQNNLGAGFFLNNNLSGQVLLCPAP